MITIQAKDFDGNKCQASVGDILFGNFFIDNQFSADGVVFTPVEFHEISDAEFEDQFEDYVASCRR